MGRLRLLAAADVTEQYPIADADSTQHMEGTL